MSDFDEIQTANVLDERNEITRLRAENETLRRDVKTAIMGDSAELQDVKRENEKLRAALKPFANYYTLPTFEEIKAAAAAIRESGE